LMKSNPSRRPAAATDCARCPIAAVDVAVDRRTM
jgi:hypothetical protein